MLTRKTAAPLLPSSVAGRAVIAVLLSALGGCTLSDSLIPPNPIPETRPYDTSGYSQSMTPADPSAREGSVPIASPGPVSVPVQANSLPPVATQAALRLEPSHQADNADRRAAAFPASNHGPVREPAVRAPRPSGRTQPQPVGAPLARREAPRQATVRVRFTPVIGAPVTAIRPLSEQLEKSASRHGVVIRNTADEPVDNILRGYFSASGRGSHTELVYMWDILDSSGMLLHRLQGTLELPGGSDKPWASVREATMRDVARKTIAAYLAWRDKQAG